MTCRLTTIVSDAQAGAARGALEAAVELDLAFGGWTSVDELPALYRERARQTSSPRMAARLNTQDSDGTLIISFAPELRAGSPASYADEAVEHQRKASLHVVLPAGERSTIPEELRKGVLEWVAEERILVLHVTGPLEVAEGGAQQAVRDALVWIFEDEVRGTVAPEEPAAPMPVASTPSGPSAVASQQAVPPATLPQADRLPEDYIVRIAAKMAEAGGRPTHIAINPANVDAAIAAGLDVQWLPMAPPPRTIDDIVSPLGVTWAEVRKRSEAAGARGHTTFCADCYFMFAAGGVPCRKHTLPGEVDARDRLVNSTRPA